LHAVFGSHLTAVLHASLIAVDYITRNEKELNGFVDYLRL